MMKKIITILAVATAMLLSACENDSGDNIDMEAFLTDVQQGVWVIDDCDMTYTNGETSSWRDYLGASFIDNMMLLPNGVCRTFSNLIHIGGPTVYGEGVQWSVSNQAKNTLVFYSKSIEENAKTANYAQYAAETTLELMYYKDGAFVMKGMQPFAYTGGQTSQGVYWDYCTVVGHVATDRTTVDKYLSYISYEQFKAEHPELFE